MENRFSIPPSSAAHQHARLLARMEDRIARLERSKNLTNASIDGGTLPIYDTDGNKQMEVGLQPDGTFGQQNYNTTPPPAPAAPDLDAGADGLTVIWDGSTADASPWPLDFDHVEVHIGASSDFTTNSLTRFGSIFTRAGGSLTLASAFGGATVYARLVAVNTSGTKSAAGPTSSIVVPSAVSQDVIDDINQSIEDAYTALNKKGATFFNNPTLGDPTPTATGVNDLWYRPDQDYRMYRWDGTAWVASQLGTDALVAGAITEDLLAADAVTMAALAPDVADPINDATSNIAIHETRLDTVEGDVTNITTVQLPGKNKVTYSTSLPGTTANIAGDTWFVWETVGGTIISVWKGNGGTSWTQMPVGGATLTNLDAGTITVGTLAAGRIGVGTLTVDKLTVGALSDSALANGSFEDWDSATKPTLWIGKTGTGYAGATYGKATGASAIAGSASPTLQSAASNAARLTSERAVPVVPGQKVYAAFAVKAASVVTNGVTVGIDYYTAADVLISGETQFWNTATTAQRLYLIGTPPATAAKAYVWVQANSAAAGVLVTVDDAECRKLVGSALIADASILTAHIGDASVTNAKIANLDAAKITTGTLDAARIAAGTITVDKLNAIDMQANLVAARSITADALKVGVLEAGFVLSGKIQVGTATWTPSEGLIFPGSMILPAPTGQTVTISGAPTGGTFTLTGNGATTSAIAYNASAATVQTAVRALGGAFTNATVTAPGAGGPYSLDVAPVLPASTLTANSSLTGGTSPTVTITAVTPASSFTGGITATSLTVQKDFNLLGTSNQIKGTLTLANGIVAPTVAPTVWQSWNLVGSHAMPFGAVEYGLTDSLTAPTTELVTAVAFFGAGLTAISKTTGQYLGSIANGNVNDPAYKAWCVNFLPTGGVTTIGNYYYVLGTDSSRPDVFGYAQWFIYRIDSSGNKQGEVNVGTSWSGNSPYFGGRPTIGKDDSGNILMAWVNSASDPFNTPGQMVISTITPANTNGGSFTGAGTVYFNTFPGLQGSNFSAIRKGNLDFGATRYVVALESNYNYVFDTSGNRASDVNAFPPANGHTVRGLHWDGTRFWSYGTDGSLYKHGVSNAVRTVTASYTWYDGDTSSGSLTHETTASPATSFNQAARTFLNVQTSEAPDSGVTDATQRDKANRVGIYVGIGAAARRLQAYNGVDGSGRTIRDLQIDTVNTGSQTDTTPTGFLGATNSPGLIQSYGASTTLGYKLNGDGSGSIAGVTWDATGAFTSTKMPVTDTGWLRPGAAGGPTWGAGWSDNTSSTEAVVMRKLGNTVKVRGLAWRTSGTGLVIINLPVGCRPTRTTYRPALISASWAYLSIGTNGDVAFSSGGSNPVNSSNAVGFEFEFDIDQPA
jgi:hypothetical protein